MASQRLQKILAQAGISSRRSAERLIIDGRVRVNGRIISELGARANPVRDRVEVDGKRLVAEKPVYYLMHKPRGVVTTLDDPEGRKSIKELLRNIPERLFPVGRLDFQTSGALLLTNDGAITQSLLHPTKRVPKTYHVKIQGSLDAERLELLRKGVTLDDGDVTAPAEADIVRHDEKHTFVDITIAEGKNRQVHRMLEAVGRVVLRLTRVSFAGLQLEGLRPGQMRPLTTSELNELKQKYLNPSKKVRPAWQSGAPQRDAEQPIEQDDDRSVRGPFGGREGRGARDPGGARDERVVRGSQAVRVGTRNERATPDKAGVSGPRVVRTGRDAWITTVGGRDERGARDPRAARGQRFAGGGRDALVQRGGVRGPRDERGARDARNLRGQRVAGGVRGARSVHGQRDPRSEGLARGPRDTKFARGKIGARNARVLDGDEPVGRVQDDRNARGPRFPRGGSAAVDPRVARVERTRGNSSQLVRGRVDGATPKRGRVDGAAPKRGRVDGAAPKRGRVGGAAPKRGRVDGATPKRGRVVEPTPARHTRTGLEPKRTARSEQKSGGARFGRGPTKRVRSRTR